MRPLVRLLEADPALGAEIPPPRRDAALRSSLAPVVELEPGPIDGWPEIGELCTGALIIEGLVTTTLSLDGVRTTELLGPGDVVLLVDPEVDAFGAAIRSAWEVQQHCRLAMFGGEVRTALARFPELSMAIAERQARRAAVARRQHLIAQLRRLDRSVELLLWLLADRYGKVSSAGVRVDLPLTHRMLAELLGAQRPSVTVALQRLAAAGTVQRDEAGRFLLCGEPPRAGGWGPSADGAPEDPGVGGPAAGPS